MPEEGGNPRRIYWRYVWRYRVKPKFFSLYRAIPAVLVSILQFLWRRTAQTSFAEMWISLAIIVGVYIGLFLLDALWSFIVLTPPQIYGEQIGVIQDWIGRCGALERETAVSPTEQRRREQVQKAWQQFTTEEKDVVRFVFDKGEVNAATLRESCFDQRILYDALTQKGMKCGLIMYRRDTEPPVGPWGGGVMDSFWVNPTLKDALEFVLAEQGKS
jgi:hypothetical protein